MSGWTVTPDTTLAPRDTAGVVALLLRHARSRRLIGVELETGVLRRADGAPAPYEDGIELLLTRLLETGAYRPQYTPEGKLIALEGIERGEVLTLEPGGQFEVATRPQADLVSLMDELEQELGALAATAESVGLDLVGGGLVPAPAQAMPWMPKPRYGVMRSHFLALGPAGRLYTRMMQRTLSLQVSFDYTDERDAVELLRLGFLASPVVTAMCASSPLDFWEESGLVSLRAEAWLFTDPHRSGDVVACMRPDATLASYVDYVLDVPMLFRVVDGEYRSMQGVSFRQRLAEGRWQDGAPVSVQDLWDHLSGVFTNARLKRSLVELRSSDGPLPGELGAIPALWTGLVYDATSRRAALELLAPDAELPRDELHAAVARDGLRARLGDRSALGLARALLELARAGLERRVAAGLEQERALDYLRPMERRLNSGVTAADELLERWRGEWGRQPARLISALRFPPR